MHLDVFCLASSASDVFPQYIPTIAQMHLHLSLSPSSVKRMNSFAPRCQSFERLPKAEVRVLRFLILKKPKKKIVALVDLQENFDFIFQSLQKLFSPYPGSTIKVATIQ